jgi:branched-chain amino acid transport system substrate-binding protein
VPPAFHPRPDGSASFRTSTPVHASVHNQPFSARDHDAFTLNMIWLATWRGGALQFVYADDAKKAAVIRRKTQ